MNKILSAVVLLSIYFLPGCASKGPEFDQSIVPVPKASTNTIVADSTKPAAAIILPAPVKQTNPTPVVSTTTTSANTKTASGLNPAHGQPGHRCDLSVGAPLNSKPNPQVKTIATSPIKTTATPVTNAAGVRLNPEHGQPGHDCKIPVGQPLKN